MKILYSEHMRDSASKNIRIIQSLARMEKAADVSAVSIETVIRDTASDGKFRLDNPAFNSADMLYLHLIDINENTSSVILPVIDHFISTGRKFVCDTDDDYFSIPDDSPFKKGLAGSLDIFREVLSKASLVTVTGEFLKEALLRYNSNVAIIPNLIDRENCLPRPGGNKTIRLGWGGGPTHLQDLELILPAIREIQREFEIELVLQGLFQENMDGLIEKINRQGIKYDQARNIPGTDPYILSTIKLANSLQGIKYTHLKAVPYSQYHRALSNINIDIGLAPIIDTHYNRCRSAIKFYQYASVNTITLASSCYPYGNECNLLAENDSAGWVGQLRSLLNDHSSFASILADQQNYVFNQRVFDGSLEHYQPIFE